MSVICQNFVQNAWKKDLCSNCFKSVGDHEQSNSSSLEESDSDHNEHCHSNGKMTPEPSIEYPSKIISNPHTTWKTLISEKNNKNSQPFKLENGFQGRLLTINKYAVNGCVKDSVKENNSSKGNAVISKSKENTSNNVLSNGETNSHIKTQNATHKFKNGTISKNAFICNDKKENISTCNGVAKGKKEINGQIKNDSKKEIVNAFKNSTNLTNGISENVKNNKETHIFNKTTKIENSSDTHLLHSILKKTITTSTNGNTSQRRGSNVGFKDEEPLVIGYGGRDFSPEELEWDLASSDDAENLLDSLDETEDDKAFTKITKENTEFNSDTSNLLAETKENSDSNDNDTTVVKNEPKPLKIDAPTRDQSITNDKSFDKNNENENQISNNEESDTEFDFKDKMLNGEHSESSDDDRPLNVTTNVDKASHVLITEEENTTLTKENEANEGVNEYEEDKNSIGEKNRESLSSSVGLVVESEETVPPKDAVMLTDCAETWPKASGESELEWTDTQNSPGQVLQAVNTSLTNRHKMDDKSDQTTCIVNDENTQSEENFSAVEIASSENHVSKIDDVPATKIAESRREEKETNSSLVVEPQPSFLHGTSANSNNVTTPSAIYGPGSDLFVSRSDSSSSSSEDLRKSQISIVDNNTSGDSEISSESKAFEDHVRQNSKDTRPLSSPSCLNNRTKPKIPAKPFKPPTSKHEERYSKPIPKVEKSNHHHSSENTQDDDEVYYSIADDIDIDEIRLKENPIIDHYAESNVQLLPEVKQPSDKEQNGRESKLAALALELEQARHINTKRQAPAPPKVPDPPLEELPSCRPPASPCTDRHFRGEVMAFSSASSTTSSSSQDNETGYASWNPHEEHQRKSKSSFLLTQYSKCKMLAMGYADDKTKKRFSLKKLLKIGKEAETPVDPSNPKAWKYSEERPRAKLEIIHPMDLENTSVTVNPGFDSLQSMSSFATTDDCSIRNSVSSDYGSFYSDTMSPGQDIKSETGYEYIQPREQISTSHEATENRKTASNSTSPTPSRCSSISQASTLTSGSSKTGSGPPNRPPKPPPPPRAHSLLPRNKTLKNPDGTFKFPVTNGNEENSQNGQVPTSPKPQAPKRQGKSGLTRSDYNFAESKVLSVQENQNSIGYGDENAKQSYESTKFENDNDEPSCSMQNSITEDQYQDVLVNEEEIIKTESKLEISSQFDSVLSSLERSMEDINAFGSTSSLTVEGGESDDNGQTEPETSTIVSINNETSKENIQNSVSARNKHPPVTKAPIRPPPIYTKPQTGNSFRNNKPWKTLEESYLVLASSNREILIRLVNQALKRRQNFLESLHKNHFQWSDFEIDASQPLSVFAFGEKIAYHATLPKYPEYQVTLVITVQQQCSLNESNDLKYPILGQFTDYIPSDLIDNSNNLDLESMPATILVLDRSNVTTIEYFIETLPDQLTEEKEKEVCFIVLQVIHFLKSLQAQGTELIEPNFQNLILAKSEHDNYYSLVSLSDNSFEEMDDYSMDNCKISISLCQYALTLLLQMLKIETIDEFASLSKTKFSSTISRKIFQTAIVLLCEEKAVSLSQTKMLIECFIWNLTKILERPDYEEDGDGMLHRWLDIERSNYIKTLIFEDSGNYIHIQNELYSQFLIRTTVRSIKEVISYL